MPNRSDRPLATTLLLFLLLAMAPSPALVAQTPEPADSLLLDTASGVEPPETTGEIDSSVVFDSSDAHSLSDIPDSARDAIVRRHYDSSAIVSRSPSDASIERIRSDASLRYDVEGRAPETIWDRLKEWLRDLLGDAVATPAFMRVMEWVFYIAAGAIVSFAIWKIVTSSRSGLLARDAEAPGFTGGAIENIREIGFDPLIDQATRDGDYRTAVRLLYLKGLQRLSVQGLIDWRRDALNHEYLRQLDGSPLADPFARCTLLFEYVWYGDFPVDRRTFESIAGTIRGFIGRVEGMR